jgi:indole-3-glycerol phosphate synthase
VSASLQQILAATRRRLHESRPSPDLRELERAAQAHVPTGFGRALESRSKQDTAIIAELKKASPSRGLIRADFRAGELAAELERSGAAALSVLTDEQFFLGSLENLRLASSNTRVPCLRKDFILEEVQILEARAYGADAVLLIVAALADAELRNLVHRAADSGLDVLCEVHDEEELRRAVDAGCHIIGVNSRDLRTFKVDLNTAFRLADQIPAQALRVAESGIRNGADIARLRAAGYQAFLIGESLMAAESAGEALRTLIAESKAKPVATLG